MSKSVDIDFEIEVDVNIPKVLASVDDPQFGLFAAEEWYKLYRDYVPHDSGTLYETIRLNPWEIDHIAPYSVPVYENNRNYRRDKAPKATAHWNEAAEPVEKPKLVKSLQNYIDQGRLKIND